MRKLNICSLLSVAAITCLGLSVPTFAAQVIQTIELGTVFTGASPNGTAPWLVGTFVYDPGTTTGTLTLQSNLTNGNFLQSGPTGWGFNVVGLSGLTCTSVSCVSNVGFTPNSGPVPGIFNLAFYWNSKARFDGSDSETYAVSFTDLLGSTSPFTPNADGWTSFAHVQGITLKGCATSGWIVDDGDGIGAGNGGCDVGVVMPPPPTVVPEPSELGILGLGVLLLGGFVGLRRRVSGPDAS